VNIFDDGSTSEFDGRGLPFVKPKGTPQSFSRVDNASKNVFPPKGWGIVGAASSMEVNVGPCFEFRSGPVMP